MMKNIPAPLSPKPEVQALPGSIRPSDYPQLRRLCWQLSDSVKLTPEEALNLYERNWRHVDRADMDERESQLLEALIQGPGKGHLLV